tara:strand:- start:325 stop:1257 length:933 start_codon:yes stop_codon:yes gene_type:complete
MKIIWKIFILFFFITVNSNSAITNFSKGTSHEGDVYWKHRKITLPPGKWESIERWGWSEGFWDAASVSLVQYTNNYLTDAFSFGEIDFKGRYQSYIAPAIEEILYHDPYDGCYKRSEYTMLKLYKKGKVHNCFIITHVETNKELYRPDNAESKVYSAAVRKWIGDNNIILPKILLCVEGVYYAPIVRDTFYSWSYCRDPETYGATKSKFFTEETSEYHPSNINNFSDKKKFMNDWIIISAKLHQSMEINLKAYKRHKLDFSEYNLGGNENADKDNSSSNLTKEIKELKKLYDEGVLTKEEFEKAKKKILN